MPSGEGFKALPPPGVAHWMFSTFSLGLKESLPELSFANC